MIVRQFLSWVRTAPASERAEATRALARAYLISDLAEEDRIAAEGALLMLLDDASPLVRRAMADVFARSADAPPTIVHALANDQPAVAAPILEHSPLLVDADLVDIVATVAGELQSAVARRELLPATVCAAIAEVGGPEACLALLENVDADVIAFSLDRIAARHGHLAPIRELLIARDDLPAPTRLMLADKLSDLLTEFAIGSDWLDEPRGARLKAEARERTRIQVAAEARGADLAALVAHLRQTGQLTAGLLLRALLCGNSSLLEYSLSDLAGMPVSRVSSLVADRNGSAITALMSRAGLPASTFIGFSEAILAMAEVDSSDSVGGVTRLRRRMVERVLMRCSEIDDREVEPLLTLLRRFATEAAREEARLFCDELIAEQDSLVALDAAALALHHDLDGVSEDEAAYEVPAYEEAQDNDQNHAELDVLYHEEPANDEWADKPLDDELPQDDDAQLEYDVPQDEQRRGRIAA
jgi:uncharacterized protein (DUF2336 family)